MIDLTGVHTVPQLRAVRREHSKRLRDEPTVLPLALSLLDRGDIARLFAYELVHHHAPTFRSLRAREVRRLGDGMDSWSAVDSFAYYISGPALLAGQISDAEVAKWARSKDRWWRRAALVSTVPLSRAGGSTERVTRICAMLAKDRDDMVVKALSWALRELTKTDRRAVELFLAEHDVAARVRREVGNKLRTGRKNQGTSAQVSS
jgi:3-methyladenine DNA glycosylase AlkD